MKDYVVVCWEDEKAYSTVALKKVQIGSLSIEEIIRKSLPIKWDNRIIDGRIEGVGRKSDMVDLERKLAQEAANLSFMEEGEEDAGNGNLRGIKRNNKDIDRVPRKRNNNQQFFVCAPFSGVNQDSDPDNFDNFRGDPASPSQGRENNEGLGGAAYAGSEDGRGQSVGNSAVVGLENGEGPGEEGGVEVEVGNEVQDQVRNTRIKEQSIIAKLQEENLALKKQLKQYGKVLKQQAIATNGSEGDTIQIAPGILISAALVQLAKISYASKPSLFFRKLLFEGNVFSLEEIAGSSLTGKKAPLSRLAARPALDPIRFNALKEYVIKTCGLQPKTFGMLDFEQKLKFIPGDARRRQNKV